MNGTGVCRNRIIPLFVIMVCLVFTGCQKASVQQAEGEPVGSHPDGAVGSLAGSPESQSDVPVEEGVGSQGAAPQDGAEHGVSGNRADTSQEGLMRSLDSLVPDGWQLGTDAYGHPAVIIGYLDGDSVLDVVLVFEREGVSEGGDEGSGDEEDAAGADGGEDVSNVAGSADESEADGFLGGVRIRKLIIAFGREDGSYHQEAVFDDLILSSGSGGVWGDPFDGLSFDQREKEITINHYGGSNWRWYTIDTLNETDGNWQLAKRVEGSYFTGDRIMEEAAETTYDYLAGTYTKRTFDENLEAVFEEGKIDMSAPRDNNR